MLNLRHPSTLVTALLVTLVLGCGGTSSDTSSQNDGRATLRSNLERDQAPFISDTDFETYIDGHYDFTVALYRSLELENSNTLISPFSIHTAFGLLHAGAAGATEAEIESALRYNLQGSDVYPALNKFSLDLESRNWPGNEDKDPVELSIVNTFWGQQGLDWKETYLDRIALHYGAGIETLNFAELPDESRLVINNHVADSTRDRIKDLLPPGAINSGTVAVLTNALFFKAPWAVAFDTYSTSSQSFTNLDGTTSDIELMYQMEWAGYYEDEELQALELDYANHELSMVFILPKDGQFNDVESELSGSDLKAIVDNLRPAMGDIRLPKFTFESDFLLNQPLADLGMSSLFQSADLSRMLDNSSLAVTGVFHKTFIALDEAGTEAAAATAIAVTDTAAPSSDFSFRADRPFLFMIRDKATNGLLFFGRVSEL